MAVEDVPDARVVMPSDAVVRVLRAGICGSDLWSFSGVRAREPGERMGHEFIGVVEDIGREVTSVRIGTLVVAPFRWSDGTCPHCRGGMFTSCPQSGAFGTPGSDGGQGEAVRVPWADGTLVRVPGGRDGLDESRLRALLALTDVAATGLHGAVMAGVIAGARVAVIGDGAVGLLAVLMAKHVLGADRVVLLGSHTARTDLGRKLGADDVVADRGQAGIDATRELFDGLGVAHVVEAVGTPGSWATAVGIVRDGGQIGAVGVPHTTPTLALQPLFSRNIGVRIGVAPVRKYLPDLMDRVMRGDLDPGVVLDRELPLAQVGTGYAAMSGRTALKVCLVP